MMLARGDEQFYRAALAAPHEPYTLVEVLNGQQEVIASDVVYMTGSVQATLTSRISRVCTMTCDESLYPFNPTDLLAPYGNMLRVWYGLQFGDGSSPYRWPIFVGRIQQATLDDRGTCTIRASDFAADVQEARFVRPENSQPTSTVTSEIVRLISDGFPQAQFDRLDSFATPVRARTWQLDRGQALDEMATSVAAFWYPRADGQFVLRRYPWTVQEPTVAVLSDAGKLGVISATSASRSREGVYNSLTVAGERLNGDPAVYALAQDTNPASPTYVFGNFGRRHLLLRLQTPGTQGAAQGAANQNLRRTISLSDTWEWEMATDASLELGDTVQLDVRGQTGIIQVVAAMSIPFDMSGPMRVTGRARVAEPLTGEI